MSKKLYVLYDERAIDGNPSDASVLDSGFNRKQFYPYDGSWGLRVCLYEYDVNGKEIENGKLIDVLEDAEVSQ